MSKLKLVLDTNILVDFLHKREPFFDSAYKLMLCARVGEFDLCITSSQITDLVYILSNGGQKSKIPETIKTLQALRTFVEVIPIGAEEVDVMLASSWDDPEDYLVYQAALGAKADVLVSRNAKDFKESLIPVFNCEQLFDWLAREFRITYAEVDF